MYLEKNNIERGDMHYYNVRGLVEEKVNNIFITYIIFIPIFILFFSIDLTTNTVVFSNKIGWP